MTPRQHRPPRLNIPWSAIYTTIRDFGGPMAAAMGLIVAQGGIAILTNSAVAGVIAADLAVAGLSLLWIATTKGTRPVTGQDRLSSVHMPTATPIRTCALTIASIVGIVSTILIASLALRMFSPTTPDQTATGSISITVIAALVLICVIAPITEEILFRGIVYEFARRKAGLVVAVAWTTGLFVICHIITGSGWVAIPLSILTCLLTEATGQLRWAVLCHSVVNILAVVLPTAVIDALANTSVAPIIGIATIITYSCAIATIAMATRPMRAQLATTLAASSTK